MQKANRGVMAVGCVCFLWGLGVALLPGVARGEVITLKNGYQLDGKIGRLANIAPNPLNPSSGGPELIVLVDDELRRMFVPFYQVKTFAPPTEVRLPGSINVEQRVASGGSRITSVGVPLRITPFDEFGRRTYSMQTSDGPIHIIQGMTKVTPTYIQLKGLVAEKNYIWDTKIPTSSVSAELLSKILRRQAGDDPDMRQAIVRLYIEAERYQDAKAELEQYMKDFPEITDVKKLADGLQQASALRMVKEIEQRRDAGQHRLAIAMCNGFPVDGVAGVTRLKIGEILAKYNETKSQGDRVIELFDKFLAELPDDRQKDELAPIREEIATELNIHNIDRMADFLRLADAEEMKADQKLSLAVSGWYLGKGEATENLSVAIALHGVRNLVRDYLQSTHEAQRAQILMDLEKYEGGSPVFIAKILANMKPPMETEHDDKLPPGMFEISVPGLAGQPDVTYVVQLPPEYDPYRKYQTIVTLNSQMTTPAQQLAWWCGDYNEQQKMRMGQASRRGAIVIAPVWSRLHQTKYEFSAQEHAAVLFSLRDAMQRFSIDTDKVFLSGHSMGGDAAWDIALAHPDLWAGVIPVGASVEKYILKYYENGKYVPLYYVGGEMDGDRFAKCGQVLDKYLTRTGYDAVVVQYQARGHEHFYDEIQHMFGWMDYHRRDPLPKSFTCVSLRPWDNFFWWIELESIPPKFVVLPAAWNNRTNTAQVEAEMKSATSISVRASDGCKAILYLTPEMVNFENRFTVTVNGKSQSVTTQPSMAVMLEDARTRSDRQHPFWQKLELK